MNLGRWTGHTQARDVQDGLKSEQRQDMRRREMFKMD